MSSNILLVESAKLVKDIDRMRDKEIDWASWYRFLERFLYQHLNAIFLTFAGRWIVHLCIVLGTVVATSLQLS